jgi:hypothetical protein
MEIKFSDLIRKIPTNENEIYVIHESSQVNGGSDDVNWISYKFKSVKECVNFFMKLYFIDKNGKPSFDLSDDDLVINADKKNELCIEIYDGLTFLFQNENITRKFKRLLLKKLQEE